VLVLGGASEIAAATLEALDLSEGAEVILAGRDRERLEAVARHLPGGRTFTVDEFDALDSGSVTAVIERAFSAGTVDLALVAFGVLGDQDDCERNPASTREMFTVNVTEQAVATLDVSTRMRAHGRGVIVVLSSVAAVRPRKANFVYGAGKAALDAFARGLADSLHGTGVHVLLVRPGFVIGRMTAGMKPAVMAVTPTEVGQAIARAVERRESVVWVPPRLRWLALAMRLVPRPLWRRTTR
jgi:decaprenylphospho-beta-D-erythro-pentofuranosid-2-ulose 2-reductase